MSAGVIYALAMASRRSREVTEAEYSGIELADARLAGRALAVARAMVARPSASLPEALRNDSDLEGTYRLLKNHRVMGEELLAPHRRRTIERGQAAAARKVPLVVVHDTTEMTFGGSYLREDMGLLPNGTQGFLAHTSLLVAREGEVRDPLGVLGVTSLVRTKPKGRRGGTEIAQASDSEGNRWFEAMKRADEALGGPGKVVHVADREADAYRLLAQLKGCESRYVIRNKHDRRTITENGELQRLHEAVREKNELVLTREVPLCSRHPGEKTKTSRSGKKVLKGASYVRTPASKKGHPSRTERQAVLHVTAGRYVIKRPKTETTEWPSELPVHVVHVFEKNPPEDEQAVEWFLLTNEPIDTVEQVAAIVDTYRSRWIIEEYFKALKTGCNYERSQLESFHSLENLLCLLLPIAWRMLRMRALSRSSPDEPASSVLTAVQIRLLRYDFPKLMPRHPTVAQALLAVAANGGHIKNNGPPGWLVLQRGFHDLLMREAGFCAHPAYEM